MSEDVKPIDKVYVIAKLGTNIALTSRLEDSASPMGLPGGRVSGDENIFEAVRKLAREDGWEISIDDDSPYVAEVYGERVAWVKGNIMTFLTTYKSKDRGILPYLVPLDDFVEMNNELCDVNKDNEAFMHFNS